MAKKIFGVYLAKLDAPNSEANARLELPASLWELHDAMDKVQLQENEELYLEVDDYYAFEYLAPHLVELDASLNELNDLAGQLAVLDETEQEVFDGLLRLEIQRKVESNAGILTMQNLRDLAVSAGADCCHVVGATSDAELGRFYAENGFMEELDGLSDDVFEMLDFGKIGKALRTGENGTFTRNGYVVQHSELVTAPPCAKELPEKPEYLFRLIFVSLPMTTIDGTAWNYDVTVYPKNQTGNPTLDKTVREDKNSTGKNTGSLTDIADGYEHTASASIGDTVDYQIISTLPTITSKASALSEYTYVDTLSRGIRYNKNDVVIEFFKDAGCTDKITTWDENSGKFTVAYDDAQNIMTIRMTEAGLAEINEAATVYTDSVKRGYSDCTMRITYAATLTADAQMGDTDNPNEVELTWKRTNTTYFDTLKDCCHVYTYGIDVLKQFSDGKGDIQDVKFLLHNDSDDCYIIADLKDGIYYAKGITTKKSDATTFVPNSSGHIIVKGLEDDSYSLTETATDKGYVLLKDAVKIIIKAAENGQCEKCGAKLLTASATVNGKDVTMTDGSAIVPLTVVNNPGFDLPKTGGYGTWMFTIGGVVLLGAAAFIVIRSRKHKNEQ